MVWVRERTIPTERCNYINEEKTSWPESASELYRTSDRRLSAKLMQTFADRGFGVVSVTDPYGRILWFLDRSRYFFSQLAPQLYSRGWVDPDVIIHFAKIPLLFINFCMIFYLIHYFGCSLFILFQMQVIDHVTWIIHQPLWGYRVEEKLHLGFSLSLSLSLAWVRERTILTEQPTLVGEVRYAAKKVQCQWHRWPSCGCYHSPGELSRYSNGLHRRGPWFPPGPRRFSALPRSALWPTQPPIQ
jgi:hypothetical protein